MDFNDDSENIVYSGYGHMIVSVIQFDLILRDNNLKLNRLFKVRIKILAVPDSW